MVTLSGARGHSMWDCWNTELHNSPRHNAGPARNQNPGRLLKNKAAIATTKPMRKRIISASLLANFERVGTANKTNSRFDCPHIAHKPFATVHQAGNFLALANDDF